MMVTREPTEAERALSAALLRELAPDHADHYAGLVTLTIEVGHTTGGYTSACETGLEFGLDASLSWCSCGAYMPGVIVGDSTLRRVRTEQEVAEVVARLTGVRLRG